jgi:hypothetical protein
VARALGPATAPARAATPPVTRAVAAPPPLHRVIYADDPALRVDRRLAEQAYGAKLVVLPLTGSPPARPARLPGIVLHADVEADARWVLGERNPHVELWALKRSIPKDFPGVGDIDDKWHEYTFLTDVQDTWPSVALDAERLASWGRRLHRLDPEILLSATGGRLAWTEVETKPRRAARRAPRGPAPAPSPRSGAADAHAVESVESVESVEPDAPISW